MKCLEYRDLAELLRDGALAVAETEEARRHADGCDACRSFEEECSVLLAPLAGLPPGPFLPEGPGSPGLPPWAAGAGGTLLAFLATVGITGMAAVSILGSGSGVGEVGEWWDTGAAAGELVEFGAALDPAPRGSETASATVAPMGDGVLSGRIVGADGAPVRDARVSLPGGPSASTDAAGLFTLRGLPAPGSSRLRLEAPGLAAEEFLGPFLQPGVPVLLEEMAVASPVPVELRVLTPDALPAAGARVLGCRSPLGLLRDERTLFERGAGCDGMPAAVEATTGPDGVARFPALARGTWSFVAEKPPFARTRPVVVRTGLVRGEVREPLLLDPAAALEGVVVDDESGEPIPGAEVLWVRMLDQARSEDPRCHGRTLAGPDGRFRFEAAPAVPLRVRAARPGLDLLVAVATVDAGRLPRVELRLPRVGTLRGRCVEASTGAPATDVDLEVAVTQGSFLRTAGDNVYVRSGPDGRFEVAGIPVSAAVRVQPVFGGRWTTATPRDDRDPGSSRDVTLRVQRAGTIRGTARGAGGAAAAGAELRAFARTFPGGLESRTPVLVAATRAAADGRFELENLPATTVLVVSGRSGSRYRQGPLAADLFSRLGDTEPQRGRVEVAPGAVVPLDIVVPPPEPEAAESAAPSRRTLRGRVVDQEGAPVSGARLCVDPGDWSAYFSGPVTAFLRMPTGTPVPVAADGAFSAELAPLPASSPAGGRGFAYTIRAFAPDRPIAFLPVTLPAEGASEEIRVVMAPGAVLEGTLLHEDGRPVAGAVLEAVSQKSVFSSGVEALFPQTATGSDGSFRIGGLAAEPHALLVLRPGAPTRVVRDLRPGEGPREIRLAAPFDIRGSVRGPDGTAVPRAFVLWEAEDRSEAPTHVRAGEDGSFVLLGVPRVRYRLRIGSASALEDPGEFVQTATPLLDPGDEPRVVVLDRGLTIEGIVEDPTGAPSAATHVSTTFEREGVRFARIAQSGSDGSFRLAGLPSGRVVLRAAGRALAGEAEADAGSAGVRIRLREATGAVGANSFVAGRALGSDGKPLAQAEVLLLGPAGETAEKTHSNADGRFALPANGAVRYTLTVAGPGGATAWLDGVQGGAKDAVLRVGGEPGGSLRGRVVDTEGRPVAGVPVHAFRIPAEAKERGTCRFESGAPVSGTLPRSTVTGADGAFDLGSPPGRWTVFAGSPGRGPAPVAAVAWDAAEPRALEVGTSSGRTLRASVSLGDTPPSVVEVRLESLLPAPAPVVTIRVRPGPDGTIEVPALPAGPVVVVLLDAKGKELGRATVEPGEPGAPPVEIRPGR
jgi:protocatechuate 3,4-dioxygenase beta subunit